MTKTTLTRIRAGALFAAAAVAAVTAALQARDWDGETLTEPPRVVPDPRTR